MNFSDFFSEPKGCMLVSGNPSDRRGQQHLIGLPSGQWFHVYPDRIETESRTLPVSGPEGVRQFLKEVWKEGGKPWENGWFFLLSYEAAIFLTPGFHSHRILPSDTVLISAFKSQSPIIISSNHSIPGLSSFPSPIDEVLVANPGITEAEYHAAILKILERIRAGDTYELNYTWPVHIPENKTPDEILFNRMIHLNPTPFLACFRDAGFSVISGSPERFFQLNNRKLTVQPMKGTRPVTGERTTDGLTQQELADSEKDRAENLMIVDLMRNDLGRICQTGSVSVKKLFEIETHPTVFQMTSSVEGVLRDEITFSDILLALFPPGSMTGAPKIRTMELIEDIESAPRGFYSGIVGYWDGYSQAEASVLIRCVERGKEGITLRVGGGIVADSKPEEEYVESLVKLKGSFRVLGIEPERINGLDSSRFSVFR